MSRSSRSPNRVVRLGVKAATPLFSLSLELFSNCSRISARSTSDSGTVVAADEFVCGFVGADVPVVAVPLSTPGWKFISPRPRAQETYEVRSIQLDTLSKPTSF
jgi:hypothetical protein